jgi:para-nitrobenzyl esterase
MKARFLSGAGALCIALAGGLPAAAPAAEATLAKPVATKTGLVSGVPAAAKGVTVFKGIPFAAPPVGPLRWKAPQPAAAWKGVRAGDKFGNVCMQPPGKGRLNLAVDLPTSPKMSEDCLYLDVWTPAKRAGEKLPVMVWVYGGAYSEGAGSMPISDGDTLAKKGVVLVNFNYRLGSLGFLSHPELTAESAHKASGNYALMDAIAALRWVKANIAAFGGDPDNVTIFGQSAGAAMNAGLVGSPEAKGLFRRAVSESGAWMGLGVAKMNPRARAEAQTVEAAEKLGLKSLAELRALSAEDALNKLPLRQGMIVDGWIIPEDLSATFAQGRQIPVDVLVGTNAEEGSFTAGAGPAMTAAAWRDGAAKRWGSLADLGLAAYPAATDEAAKAVASAPFADAMAWHMRLFADSQARLGKQAWLYYFTNRPPYAPGKPNLGAVHASEIAYVFDNLEKPHEFPDGSSPELARADPKERALADQMSSYWVNFARTGNPNGPGLPPWPAAKDLGSTEAMVLKAGASGRGPWLSQPKIDLYKALYARDVGAR